MARMRVIKPDFFMNEGLADLPVEARLLFIGLWTIADREGRLEDRPRKIKVQLMPFDGVDAESLLGQLHDAGFILRYIYNEHSYIQIRNFTKHQQPHYKEIPSVIPPPPGHVDSLYIGGAPDAEQSRRIFARDQNRCQHCGATENLSLDHIIPRSKGGTNEDENLRVLCRTCNSRKGNRESVNLDSTLNQQRPNIEARSDRHRHNQSTSCATLSLTGSGSGTEQSNTGARAREVAPELGGTLPDDGELRDELARIVRNRTGTLHNGNAGIEKRVNAEVAALIESGASLEEIQEFDHSRRKAVTLNYFATDFCKWRADRAHAPTETNGNVVAITKPRCPLGKCNGSGFISKPNGEGAQVCECKKGK